MKEAAAATTDGDDMKMVNFKICGFILLSVSVIR